MSYSEEGNCGNTERTAFRNAEKKYKLYKDSVPNKSRRRNQWRPQHPAVDLSQVIDFNSVLHSFSLGSTLPPGIRKLPDESGLSIFKLDDCPGFYFLVNALSLEDQQYLVKESLVSFPQPPNRTNHNALYGPIHDVFDSYLKAKVLVESSDTRNDTVDSTEPNLRAPNDSKWEFVDKNCITNDRCLGKMIPAAVVLRKLRWSTLGLQFDWSKRSYAISLPHNMIPTKLSGIAKRLAKPAMLEGEFHPEAAIVNYYGPDDTLGGHVDDMEADWSKPIVSISLGCKAIFLFGGNHRDQPPIAMFLRSGDVVLMAGAARKCFHGVPRIFTDQKNADTSALALQFSSPEELPFKDYIQSSRININIRQVY